jgi:predicted O-methyltransferase YrrM
MWDFINRLRNGPQQAEQEWDEAVCLISLVLSRKPRYILEIGSRRGGSALFMAEALAQLADNNWLVAEDCRIDAVDPDCELVLTEKEQHLAKYINVIRQRSPEGVPKDVVYDLIHIDANHNYQPVLADLRVAAERSKPGTVIVLHDINFSGVQQALATFHEMYPHVAIHAPWTFRLDRDDHWRGQALVVFPPSTDPPVPL